ncbi:Bcr/CflA family drug resistance efflux transporter [Methylobacterium haplocladii]|uniref:Bcr/CflA family drug resistance efflux transporter n=2 Tax=Methylobacterium haplocladii TaxID=1176176 RepID=A0A512IU56_9HYPH|nr:Bcr/CflA family drug resistance efflux transporter [Methylobacterium haplocladii]GJD85967.1 Bicyclomycin resistance protein [Methylobacterium haplocladii]GLS59685.1 Bcr/CflA family drug resistance efflux transporter [Methylobacterium haplocladii]
MTAPFRSIRPDPSLEPTPRQARGPGFREFVGIVALMMAVTAISIDNLLPAFPVIQERFSVADPNRLQLLIYVYMVGFGLGQILYGPLSDSLGRRKVLLVSLAIYLGATVLAMFSPSFGWLLAARILQGIGAAGGRVLSLAIVRDRYAGRAMASVMSLITMVFLIVPMLAPALGQAMLLFGSWVWVFVSMLALGGILAVWFSIRMPETLHPEHRRPLSLKAMGQALRLTLRSRATLGYGTALGLMVGCIMGYVGSAEQVFDSGLYHLGGWFPAAFALVAGAMGASTLINARLVERLGMHWLSHAGLIAFVAVALVQVGIGLVWQGHPPLWLFLTVLSANQFLISFTMPNFQALAMQPVGEVAGTASSFLGFYTTLLGAAFGTVIGQSFDGTVLPVGVGYAGLGCLSLAVVAWTERGRLFRAGISG